MDREASGLPQAGVSRRPQVELGEQTRAALQSRMVIGQAVGILMLREGLDTDAAFALLVDTSQRTNTKLRDVASGIVAELDAAHGRR